MNYQRILLCTAAAAVLFLAFLSLPSCKPDEKECDTALRDTLELREIRLKEREMALREREMAILEREQQLGIGGQRDSYTTRMNSANAGASAVGGARANVKGGRTSYAEPTNQAAYKKPILAFPGQFPESSERLLTEDDVSHKSAHGIKVMLNEIYARHGYIFQEKDLKKHFAGESWYKGTERSMGKLNLTPTEIQNIAFIKQYQSEAAHR